MKVLSENKEEGPFHLVRFAARSNKSEKNTVSFTVNGREKTFRRQWILPISESFLQAARHAVTPIWSDEMKDGQNRKVFAGNAARFPFEVVHSNISEEAYCEFCKKMSIPDCPQMSEHEINSILKSVEKTEARELSRRLRNYEREVSTCQQDTPKQ